MFRAEKNFVKAASLDPGVRDSPAFQSLRGAAVVTQTDLVHSTAARKPLVAIILNILKCMFFTRKLNN